MNHRMTSLMWVVSVLLLLTACSPSTPNLGREETLRRNVKMEWDAKVRKDWGVVYDLTLNAYKNEIDRDLFIQRANVNVQEFSIKEVKIIQPGKKALAVVDYSINQKGFDFKTTSREEWLWENGDWHLDLMPTLKPPPEK